MKSVSIVLKNEEGLHARPAMEFVETAQKFASTIRVSKDGADFSAKSIVGVLSLGGCRGDAIEIRADGPDEEAAIRALEAVLCAMA
jgi:phosphocarrier protein